MHGVEAHWQAYSSGLSDTSPPTPSGAARCLATSPPGRVYSRRAGGAWRVAALLFFLTPVRPGGHWTIEAIESRKDNQSAPLAGLATTNNQQCGPHPPASAPQSEYREYPRVLQYPSALAAQGEYAAALPGCAA